MVDLLKLLPEALIFKISEYSDSKTKRQLSLVDRRTHALVLRSTKCIRVFSPRLFSFQILPSDIPEDVLVKVIRRYPNLQKVIFGPPKHLGGFRELEAQEVPLLKSLISYLERERANHPLIGVKKIEYKEIHHDFYSDFDEKKAKQFNSLFLRSIGHNRLENVRIQSCHDGSILSGTEIQPVLDNSPNLKTFVFNGFQSSKIVSLSFSGQSHLSKVKLLYWEGPASTIKSLKNSKNIEELVIHYSGSNYGEIEAILSADHPWNLKRLELKRVAPRNDAELDAITKKLPGLECLVVELHGISPDGLELLGKNCPKLKILQFCNRDVTNSGLDRLTQHLPHLEMISFDDARNITEEGISAIARNCKNLRLIRVVHFKEIKKLGIDALIENCPDLTAVEFGGGGSIPFESIHQLFKQISKLRYVKFYSIANIQEAQITNLLQTYPKISKIPSASSTKSLYAKTILNNLT